MVSGRASHPDGVLYLGPRDVDGDQLCGCHRSGSSSSGRLRRQALQDIRQIAVWVVSVELGRLDPAHDDGHSLAGTQRANASKSVFQPFTSQRIDFVPRRPAVNFDAARGALACRRSSGRTVRAVVCARSVTQRQGQSLRGAFPLRTGCAAASLAVPRIAALPVIRGTLRRHRPRAVAVRGADPIDLKGRVHLPGLIATYQNTCSMNA